MNLETKFIKKACQSWEREGLAGRTTSLFQGAKRYRPSSGIEKNSKATIIRYFNKFISPDKAGPYNQ